MVPLLALVAANHVLALVLGLAEAVKSLLVLSPRFWFLSDCLCGLLAGRLFGSLFGLGFER